MSRYRIAVVIGVWLTAVVVSDALAQHQVKPPGPAEYKRMVVGRIAAAQPAGWAVQSMITLTLPSERNDIRPNIILTQEKLTSDITLDAYFDKLRAKVKERVSKGLKEMGFEDVSISGWKGKRWTVGWDLSRMPEITGSKVENILEIAKKYGMVWQEQITLMRGQDVVNITMSAPEDDFQRYHEELNKWLATLVLEH